MQLTKSIKKRKKFVPIITPPHVLRKRWKKKKLYLENISQKMRSLRIRLTKDLKSTDEKEFLTALVISVMDCTAERVGNDDSARAGHFGVTGFRKKHIRINGNQITFRYTGKSGVKHEKIITDASLADNLKRAIKNSKSRFVFETSDGFRIRNDKVNRYLSDFGIKSKNIRGYCANTYVIGKLKKEPIDAEENKRKKDFHRAVKYGASKVGHGTATIKKHYLVPELSVQYIEHGKIINLTDFFSKGGEVLKKGGHPEPVEGVRKPSHTSKLKKSVVKKKIKKKLPETKNIEQTQKYLKDNYADYLKVNVPYGIIYEQARKVGEKAQKSWVGSKEYEIEQKRKRAEGEKRFDYDGLNHLWEAQAEYENAQIAKNKYPTAHSDALQIFVRAGLPRTKNGKYIPSEGSYFGQDVNESGVSVFRADYYGKLDIVVIDTGATTRLTMDYDEASAQKRPLYLVEGTEIGEGHDEEPLLDADTLKVIGKLNPEKVVNDTNSYAGYTYANKKLPHPLENFKGNKFVEGGETPKLPPQLKVINHFYSPIEKRVLEFKQDKASAQKWKEIIGIKSDEAVFTGLSNFIMRFKPNEQIEKTEILNYLDRNRILLEEVIHLPASDQTEIRNVNGNFILVYTDDNKPVFPDDDIENSTYDEAKEYYDSLLNYEEETGTKYHKYQLAGDAENYRELLITLPNRTIKPDKEKCDTLCEQDEEYRMFRDKFLKARKIVDDYYKKGIGTLEEKEKANEEYLINSRYASMRADELVGAYQQTETNYGEYKSSHWNEENIIAHIRFNLRKDAEGKKVFFIEEIQSDWGQNIKRKGIKDEAKIIELQKELVHATEEYKKLDFNKLKLSEIWETEQAKKVEELNEKIRQEEETFLPAPYVTNTNAWVKLALKYALIYATELQADYIAWTTGAQQNERYDLSKQIDKIIYEKNEDGTYDINVYGIANQNEPIHENKKATLKDIENLAGKDIAEKISKDYSNKEYYKTIGDKEKGRKTRVIFGEGLKVVGKGMKAFYGDDENERSAGIVGNVAKALVKELTGKEGKIEEIKIIEKYYNDYEIEKEDDGTFSLNIKRDAVYGKDGGEGFKTKALAEKFAKERIKELESERTFIQPTIQITSEIKKAVNSGMPQFKEGGLLYHGSYYLFDKFSTDKIDTGTGAQQQGWGIYFTDDKETAEDYAKQNTPIVVDGKEVTFKNTKVFNDWRDSIIHRIITFGSIDKFVEHMEKGLSETSDRELRRAKKESIKFAKSLRKKLEHLPRKLYSVEIKKQNPDYLDYDNPITESQKNKILAQLKKEKISNKRPLNDFFIEIINANDENNTGENVYMRIATNPKTNFGEQGASLFLLRAGIDGIKHKSEGGNFFIIFDENQIEIKNVEEFATGGEIKDFKNIIKKLHNSLITNMQPNYKAYVTKITNMLLSGHAFRNKTEHEKIAEKYGITKKDIAKEYAELAVVLTAREIIKLNQVVSSSEVENVREQVKKTYSELVNLYERQPSLTHRTSYTAIHAQYSTPAPISYIMGIYVGGHPETVEGVGKQTDVFYHGTTHENLKEIEKKGFDIDNADFYSSTNIYDAIGFGCDKGNKISSLLIIKPKSTAKIFDITNPFEALKTDFVQKEINDDGSISRFKVDQASMDDYVRANGYDAYVYPESLSGGGTEVDYATKNKWMQIINPKAFEYEYIFDAFPCFDFKKHNEDKTYAGRQKKVLEKAFKEYNIPLFHDFKEREQAEEKYNKFNDELEESGFDHDKITKQKYGLKSTFDAMYQILRKPIYDNLEKFYPPTSNIQHPTSLFFEPTAGTGLLTIALPYNQCIVNEIDKTRLDILRMQPFKQILSQDATQPFPFNKQGGKEFDGIITNPPFGNTHSIMYGKYKLTGLEQLISARALDYMKNTGKCAIIIGDNTTYDEKGRLKKQKDLTFFNYLAHYYNLEDVINISGDIYRRQGASYPIRIILINGRKSTPSGFYPIADFNLPPDAKFSTKQIADLQTLYARIYL